VKAYFGVGDASTAKRLLTGIPAVTDDGQIGVVGGHGAMLSFAYIGSSWVSLSDFWELAWLCDGVTLDSGAFTAWNNGTPMGDEQVEKYIEFVQRYHDRIDWAVTVDVIGDAEASLKRWRATQDLGVDLVPVWHEGDPIAHLEAYDPSKRLVCLGRIEGRQSKPCTLAFYDAAFNLFPNGRFHALGNASPDTLEPYPFESFDAVSWQRNAAYAQKHGWPWSACAKDTRMTAYIEAIETIDHRPRKHAQLRLAI